MHSIDLLPGRKLLLAKLDSVIQKLLANEVKTLADAQKFLKYKDKYPALAAVLDADVDYLVVLNREINSYVSKPLSLEAVEVLSADELNTLAKIGIRTTKDFYDRYMNSPTGKNAFAQVGIDEAEIGELIHKIDLLRINGVGPAYAKILFEIGVRSVRDYLAMDSLEILQKYNALNAQKAYSKAKLGIKDIEYCKRFCQRLDAEL